MLPPTRKRKKYYSQEEIHYLETHYDYLTVQKMLEDDIEIDVPAADKIEEKIEKEFKIINGSPLEIYRKFIALIDEYNIAFSRYMPCKKSCGKCCKIPVEITDLEKNIIKHYLEENNKTKYYNYFNSNNSKISNGLIGEEYLGMECPFLLDNECSIYSVRPYRCRRYIIFSENNSLCDYDSNEKVIGCKHIYSEIVYNKIINYYCEKRKYNVKYFDIRSAFSKL